MPDLIENEKASRERLIEPTVILFTYYMETEELDEVDAADKAAKVALLIDNRLTKQIIEKRKVTNETE